MSRLRTPPVVLVLILTIAQPLCAADFEDVVAVSVENRSRGPRGMPGDFVQLKDGALLMSYTRGGNIMGIKSLDQGKTWKRLSKAIPCPYVPSTHSTIQSRRMG